MKFLSVTGIFLLITSQALFAQESKETLKNDGNTTSSRLNGSRVEVRGGSNGRTNYLGARYLLGEIVGENETISLGAGAEVSGDSEHGINVGPVLTARLNPRGVMSLYGTYQRDLVNGLDNLEGGVEVRVQDGRRFGFGLKNNNTSSGGSALIARISVPLNARR